MDESNRDGGRRPSVATLAAVAGAALVLLMGAAVLAAGPDEEAVTGPVVPAGDSRISLAAPEPD